MKYKINNKKGISLVETVIYLAIFTMVSILVINSFITVIGSFATTRTNRSLMEAGINSMERMSREIRQADNVDVLNSSLNGDTLHLNSKDSGENLITIKFSKVNNDLNLYKCSGLVVCDTFFGNLVGENISLDSLVFRRVITAQGEAIKIEMTLSDIYSKTNKTENFYNTIILKGGY
jgi:Tfp pilus assembly protein PilE